MKTVYGLEGGDYYVGEDKYGTHGRWHLCDMEGFSIFRIPPFITNLGDDSGDWSNPSRSMLQALERYQKDMQEAEEKAYQRGFRGGEEAGLAAMHRILGIDRIGHCLSEISDRLDRVANCIEATRP